METISAAQLAANQANAALSTGPRTERGKRRSSLKAVRNGLTGQFFVLPSEDRQCYENFIKPMIDSYYPVGPQEQNLAFTIANERWRLQRLYTLENTMFANAIFEQTGDF
ncbi:MAG: hypothetical protein JO336_21020, partial [Acidobacteriia bacterium]|nr:hypothetical protein [Terriglobia bacterium]